MEISCADEEDWGEPLFVGSAIYAAFGEAASISISALYGNTPAEPQGALVVPGMYEVRLTVDGKEYKQPLEVVLDPRVATSRAALEHQFELERRATDMVTATYGLYRQATVLREAIAGGEKKLENQDADSVAALKDFDAKVVRLLGSEGRGGGSLAGKPKPTFPLLNGGFGSLATTVDGADSDPTPAMETAYNDHCHDLVAVTAGWNDLVRDDLPSLNDKLAKQKLSALPASPITANCEPLPK
jgi:hypothetical protein